MVSGRRESYGQASRRLEAVEDGPEYRPSVSSVAMWPWVELARRHGISPEHFASLTNVAVADLRDPGATFSQVACNRMAELMLQRVGSHAAIEAAQTVEAGQFTLFELLARTAPTVGDALANGSKFSKLIHADLALLHEVRSDGAHIAMLRPPPDYPLHPVYYEYTFGIWLSALRRETECPELAPTAVWLRHRPPADRKPAERWFGSGLQWGMADNLMLFSKELAAMPLARKNSTVHAAAVRAAADLCRRGDG